MHVDVVEDEATTVQVHDRAGHGVGRHVAAHPDAVGVVVGHLGDLLARLGRGLLAPRLASSSLDVEAGLVLVT